MKTLLCDLTDEQINRFELRARYDAIVGADDVARAHVCTGCFGCWTRTPGTCIVRDRLGDVGALLGATDELHIASRCTFGGWSAQVKRILDRSLGYLDPRFQVKSGELHHLLRYDSMVERVWFYGPSSEQERATARELAAANSMNRGSTLASVRFLARPEDIGSLTTADAVSAPTPACANPVSVLPHRIALVNASPRGGRATTKLILDDFSEALQAYERLDANPYASIPQLAFFTWNRPNAFDPRDLSAFGTIVLGYPLYYDSLPSHAIELLDNLIASRAPSSNTRLYAVANMGFYEPSQIAPSFHLLENCCARAGIQWHGGLAVGGGGMVSAVADTPRMGIMRRHLSETTDKLILAVRCGTDAGTIESRCPIPRFAYKLAAEAQWRTKAKRNGVRDLGFQVAYQDQYSTAR